MPELKTGNTERRYETRDVTLHTMVYSGLGLAVLVLLGFLASWFVFRYYVRAQKLGPPASPFDNTRTLPPPPRLQVHPAEDLKAYRAKEDATLDSYGWADKSAGVVRIPIERAMELSLQRGFPVRKAGEAAEGNTEASGGSPPAARPAAPSGTPGDR
jgi:hypothetical protein